MHQTQKHAQRGVFIMFGVFGGVLRQWGGWWWWYEMVVGCLIGWAERTPPSRNLSEGEVGGGMSTEETTPLSCVSSERGVVGVC
jgi:hypothetical protein